jgi:hypothetical protein
VSEPRSPLAGRHIAIAGCAQGIGRATAGLVAERGARLTLGDIDVDGAMAAAKQLGDAALALPLDVSDRDSYAAFLDSAADHSGTVDVLVANAGLLPLGPFVDGDPDVFDRTIDVNVRGVINALHLALPPMLERGAGRIVVVGSLMGRLTVNGAAVYGASKFAVTALTETVREEIHGSGVELVTVMPTFVRTRATSGVPQGGAVPIVDPEDVAEAIAGACESGSGEVSVPAWAGPIARAGGAIPPPLLRPLRQLLGGNRAFDSIDEDEREAYDRAMREGR